MNTKTRVSLALFVLCLTIMPFLGFTTNPDLSNYFINLSEGPQGAGVDDRVPEIVVEGTTVHTLWVQKVSNDESNLYYRRSTDLGETWEAAKIVKVLKDGGIATQADNRRLAVDNGTVHICIADYDYGDKGTGRIFYFRSLNNGASFESEKIIASTPGNYQKIKNSFIKVSGSKIAVAYQAAGDKKGTWALFSTNGGTSFTDTRISDESTYVADLYFDGNQMVVLYGYTYYSYGLAAGRVWVAVSQNGTSFTTNKISIIYPSSFGDKERSIVNHNYHYSPKIASSGNNIHVVFTGYQEGDKYSTFYVRSTNNGSTFESVVDIGAFDSGSLQDGSETVAAMNGNVYLLAAGAYNNNNNNGNQFYFLNSNNNGDTFSERRGIMNTDIAHIGKASLPGIAIDPNDQTGKTLYLTGNWLFSTKSVDGGESFSGSTSLAPFLESNIVGMNHNNMLSFMVIDANGEKHWISSAKWRSGNDNDIFYRNVKAQPEPGTENKALYVEDLKGTYQAELVVVPSSESINFETAMTAEVWVKFNPETQANFNILAKVNGYDGYYNQPKGYQMDFLQDKGKITINAGIKTDKGEFHHKGEINLNDNLWHHIAFTYDANGGLNNFKLYINGLLQIEKTVTGTIFTADGMLMIGSRSMGNSWYYDTKYHLDDVRLWNRALTQDELIANQTRKITGQEDGLKMFLNFDDTFKDISGNGNDGIPVYKGKLDVSDFDPPLANFDLYQLSNDVSFNNKTKNATSWLWDFGNTKTSEQGNPKHIYTTAGEYTVSLLAKNSNSVTAAVGHATIVGLDRIEPTKAGNIGESLLTVFGGGLNAGMKVLLRSEDNTEIVADTVVGSGEDGMLRALFNLNGSKTGLWDVVVVDKEEMVLSKAFTIKQAEGIAQPWVNVSGRGTVLLNRWNKFTITYGNKGDVDALMVPVSFAVPDIDGLEVDYIDFKFVLPELAKEYNLENELMPYKDFIISDNIFGKPERSRIYSLMIPRIQANSSESLHIIIKSPVNYKITSWTGDGWVKYTNSTGSATKLAFKEGQLKSSTQINNIESQTGASVEVAECITEALAVTVIETSISVIPVVGAIYNSGKTGYVVGQFDSKNKGRSVVNASLQGASTFFSYAGVIPVVGWVASTVGGLVCGGISAYLSVSDCLSLANKEKGVSTVSSFDPNEVIGPDGFGEEGWIPELNEMPYTILFENKAEATAPAHDVFITDTLDLSVLDISNFGFGSFGWGNSIYSPAGSKMKEFSKDIDMRPAMNLITRVSGKLDTLTGIITWEFLSLNPTSMDLEEDPFIGFLPPNKNSPEGEGFVSFSVGLKEGLKTNTEIRNQAAIVFDANKPIITNEYLNTLDFDSPESQVYPLEATINSHFPIAWTGSDKGSGIGGYTIYVMENDTLLYPWLRNTPLKSSEFIGEVGSTYKFYSIAIDNVSLKETAPGDYDARTTITVDVEEFDRMKETLSVWPNPVKDNLKVSFNNAPCGMYVVELISTSGSVKHSELYSDIQLQNGIRINVADCTAGQYVLRVVFGNKTETRKVVVQ